MAERQTSQKKKIGIIAIAVLLLLALSTYYTIQYVDAKKIEANLELGNKYYSEGKYKEAVIAYNDVLEIDPKNVDARVGLAKAYIALHEVPKAKKVLAAGIKIVPKAPRFYLMLSDIYLDEGNVMAAINILDKGESSTNDGAIKDRLSKISNDIELVADKTTLQTGQVANLKVVYHQTKDSGSSKDKVDTAVKGKWSLLEDKLGTLSNKEGDTNQFTSKATGSETVTVTVGSIEKNADITIKDHVLTAIDVKASVSAPKVGETVKLTATGKDANGADMPINPNWQITNGSGKLANQQGPTNTFTNTAAGTTAIVVSQDKVETNVSIKVEEKKYTLTKIATGKGTITSNPEGNQFKDGQKVTLTATPAKGWVFDHWEGDVSGKQNTASVTMSSDRKVTAVFKEVPKYSIFTSVNGQGSIQQSPMSAQYTKGTVVTLTAVPAKGWEFDHWEKDLTGTAATANVTMDSGKVIRAVFKQKQVSYSLTISKEGQGTVVKSPNQSTYLNGSRVTLKAAPAAGWKFDHWEGNASGKNPAITLVMDAAKSVHAVFTEVQAPSEKVTLTISTQGEGTITRNPALSKYDKGTTVTLTASPSDGWAFSHWDGNVSGSHAATSITLDANKQATAVFVQNGSVAGIVKNSNNGQAVQGAHVFVRAGENVHSGTAAAQGVTDGNGHYQLDNLAPGTYTLEISKDRFATKYVVIQVTSGKVTASDQTIVPNEISNFKVVLTWGSSPADLDSHLTGPYPNSTDRYEVYYGKRKITDDSNTENGSGVVLAQLDVDDTDGYGPETITTFQNSNGVFRYFVHNFSGGTPLSESQAKVELWQNNQLVRTFTVPQGQGSNWNVFEIDNGVLHVLNTISDTRLN